MNIAFCDDNTALLNNIDNILMNNGLSAQWELFPSAQNLINFIESNPKFFQIYVLDIEIAEINGIDVATKIRLTDTDAIIIFLTDYKNYVYKVFEVLPFRFLQKPVDETALIKVLKDAVKHLKQNNTLFFFNIGHQQYQVPCKDIIYFESTGRKINLYTKTDDFTIYSKLSDVMLNLDNTIFTQIHSSFIVNMEYIRVINLDSLTLSNKTILPISRRYRNNVKQEHLSFIERKCST